MDAYTGFAQVYDLFMDEVPYDTWGTFIIEQLHNFQITDGLVLDLGCGTGKMTRYLAGHGYDMTGIDMSYEMLQTAEEHADKSDILYLCQDMREFELYGTMRAIISCCDCINYIMQPEELVQVFSLVNNYLDPDGIFFFDFNTPAKYEQMGDSIYAENREESSFIWENYYDADECINEYDLTLFIAQEDGRYEKEEETHFQRGYTLEQIRNCLERAGLIFVAAYDDYVNQPAGERSERICVVAREHGKGKGCNRS